MEECKICNREFKSKSGFMQHIVYGHKISKKEYYDNFYKLDNEGICPVCGKETNFVRNGFGYNIHCSVTCINKNPETLKKIENSKLKKYGATNNTKLDYYKNLNKEIWKNKSTEELEKIREKTKNTCLEKYGKDNPAKVNDIKQKMKDTCLIKYGTEYALQNEEVKEKRKKYNLEYYGVENMFQHPDIIKKIRQNMINKGYRVDEKDYTKFENYYKKCQSLTQINIRKYSFKESWDGFDYYDNEYIKDNYNLYKPNNENYPNIDHKNSIVYGFLNNINFEDICSIDNLCFTKRRHNASKQAKIEEEYINKKSGE
jgi:hypothetical protein